MPILNKDNSKRLELYSHLSKLPDNRYLTDELNLNYQYVKERYYDDDSGKANILNIGSWLFASVSNTIGTFFDYPNMDIPVEQLNKAVSDYINLWFCIFVLEVVDWKQKLVRWYANWYVSEWWVDKIYRQYNKVDKHWHTYYYMYEKIYTEWLITRNLYKLQGKDNFRTNYDKVTLDTLEETYWLEEETSTDLSFPSLFFVWEMDEASTLQKIESNVYSIDRKICMLDSQFLQNTESIILFSWFSPQDAQDAWFKQKKWFLRNRAIFADDPATDVKFIKNTNEIIDKAMAYEEKQIRAISAITNIPLRFLWVEENDGSSGRNARMLTQSAFIKMLDNMKTEFKSTFTYVLELLNKNPSVRFKDTVLTDSYSLAEEMKIATEARIISRPEAIRKYQNLNKGEVENELKLISDEDVVLQTTEELVLWNDSSTEKDAGSQERERNDK